MVSSEGLPGLFSMTGMPAMADHTGDRQPHKRKAWALAPMLTSSVKSRSYLSLYFVAFHNAVLNMDDAVRVSRDVMFVRDQHNRVAFRLQAVE